jgi:protein ImuA
MPSTKADIIARLQKEILPLQGFKTALSTHATGIGLGPVNKAFPNSSFPVGAMHEFVSDSAETQAASAGFISAILGKLMCRNGVSVWISSSPSIFPPALKLFGIDPDKIVFIYLKKEKDILWATEEALKCEGLSAVIAEIKELDFTVSRRLQLAVEQSRVTGFILRRNPRSLLTTACIARWRIKSISSETESGLPGISFPRWNIELLKVRNGKPGNWQLKWADGKFHQEYTPALIAVEQQKKTG